MYSYLSNRRKNNQNEDMPLVEHLEELRWRLFKSVIAIVVGAVIAFIFRDYIISFLQAPLPAEANVLSKETGHKLIVEGLTEGFTVYLLISLVAGFVLALPVVLYQVYAFIVPGLYEKEKKHSLPFILIGIVLFLIGITLGYLVLRYPVEWFVSLANGGFTQLVTANSYFSFVAIFILVFGVIFELPLVLTFLAQIGIISGEMLKRKRAFAHLGMWVVATFATPGADIYSPIILGIAMSCLYELTIIFIRIFIKKDAAEATTTA